MNYFLNRLLSTLFAAFLLAGAAFAEPGGTLPVAQPPNIDALKRQLITYKTSGDYERGLAAVAAQARAYLEAHAPSAAKPALVLDIDETALSNWPRIIADDFGYIPSGACNRLPKGPCGSRAWEMMARAPAIRPTLKLFKAARSRKVAVFFITGRPESERAPTVRNLRRAGYSGWAQLIMKPDGRRFKSAADFKAPQRARIAARGYTIVANMGDQPSDLAGGHPDDPTAQFLLPNPFYRIP